MFYQYMGNCRHGGKGMRKIQVLAILLACMASSALASAQTSVAKPQLPPAQSRQSISRELAHIFAGLVADVRLRQLGNAIDSYASAFHWRVMPDETKTLLNAKTGYVGKVNDQLVMLGSDGTNDIFSLSVRDHFNPNEVLGELRQVYTLDKRASETSDGQRFDIYAIRDHGRPVGLVTLSYGVVDAIAGTGTIAFVSMDRAKKEMPDFIG
jgi:hypothetical protein